MHSNRRAELVSRRWRFALLVAPQRPRIPPIDFTVERGLLLGSNTYARRFTLDLIIFVDKIDSSSLRYYDTLRLATIVHSLTGIPLRGQALAAAVSTLREGLPTVADGTDDPSILPGPIVGQSARQRSTKFRLSSSMVKYTCLKRIVYEGPRDPRGTARRTFYHVGLTVPNNMQTLHLALARVSSWGTWKNRVVDSTG